jgi:hypothetical protein
LNVDWKNSKSELRQSPKAIDSLAPARFDPPKAGLPIYVARVPAAPFESSKRKAKVKRKKRFPKYEAKNKIKKQASRGEVLVRIHAIAGGPKLFWIRNNREKGEI